MPGSAVHRTYGVPARVAKAGLAFLAGCALLLWLVGSAAWAQAQAPAAGKAGARPLLVLAFGDSLTAGYGLKPGESFPAQLEAALRREGLNARVHNAGVSGDTSAQGRARLNWVLSSLKATPDLAIVALGANDMLRGIDPAVTRRALDRIISALRERGIEVLLVGMRAVPNLGPDYRRAYEAIFPDLAARHGVLFYPFFLDGVAADPSLNLDDRIHPNAAGVEVMVARMLPKVEELIARVRARR